jgi:hypothetical protein
MITGSRTRKTTTASDEHHSDRLRHGLIRRSEEPGSWASEALTRRQVCPRVVIDGERRTSVLQRWFFAGFLFVCERAESRCQHDGYCVAGFSTHEEW